MQHQVPYWRLSCLYFFYFSVWGALLPYWSLYLKNLGFDAGEIGWLMAVLTGTRILAPNLWGWLADRGNRRLWVIRLGAGLGFLAFLATFVARSFLDFALVIFAFTFFWNAILAQFEVVTMGHLGERRSNYSRIRLWGSIGFILVVLSLGAAFDYISLDYLPVAICLLMLMIFICSLTISERPSPDSETAPEGFVKILRTPAVWAFFAAALLLQASHGPYYVFFSLYLEDSGYSRAVTGQLWALGVVAEVALFAVMHRLIGRFSMRAIILVSLALSGVRWLLIGFWIDSLLWLLVAQCLHAFSFGAMHACAVEMVQRFFRGGHEGKGQALYSALCFGAGSALGAGVSGYFWEIAGAAYVFCGAAVLCAIALAIAMPGFRDTRYD